MNYLVKRNPRFNGIPVFYYGICSHPFSECITDDFCVKRYFAFLNPVTFEFSYIAICNETYSLKMKEYLLDNNIAYYNEYGFRQRYLNEFREYYLKRIIESIFDIDLNSYYANNGIASNKDYYYINVPVMERPYMTYKISLVDGLDKFVKIFDNGKDEHGRLIGGDIDFQVNLFGHAMTTKINALLDHVLSHITYKKYFNEAYKIRKQLPPTESSRYFSSYSLYSFLKYDDGLNQILEFVTSVMSKMKTVKK